MHLQKTCLKASSNIQKLFERQNIYKNGTGLLPENTTLSLRIELRTIS